MFTPTAEAIDPALENLITSAFRGQWAPDDIIDWSLDVALPEGMPLRVYVDMVSQLYYAEEATITVLGSLIQTVPDFQAKRYLCTQAADESRHAQVYRRYLTKLGDIAPINPGLKTIFEAALSAISEYWVMIAGLHLLMEGEALRQQAKRIETLPCPLFRQINSAIVRDEARHAAFGRIYMRAKLSSQSYEDRMGLYSWLRQMWQLWGAANENRYAEPEATLLRTEADDLGERWLQHHRSFVQIGLIREGEPVGC